VRFLPAMNAQAVENANLIGAMTAVVYNVLVIALLAARLAERPRLEYWLGAVAICSVIPLSYLLVVARAADRPPIYFVWIGLMIVFQVVELTLDYILGFEFRSVRWMAITYVMLFFGATGGMIGVAAQAGRGWVTVTVLTWFVMAALAFIQRSITGL